jgi:hypothetical protein
MMFFSYQFDLIDEKELKALKGPADRIFEEFNKKPA